jgi:hypothetical protein
MKYGELGELPQSLILRTEADYSHYEYLKNKRSKNKE